MEKFCFLLPGFAILLGLLMLSPAYGASKKKPAPPPQVHPPTIFSVTANSITVTEEKTTKTLTITPSTEITVNGQKATAAELKPSMTVSITMGTDPTKASRISATGK
ncbi:MAG: hypothetical protein DLM73_10410 [Chthoniobacterales bacterium]|nr:MAG: hypothetical protein DLM73_10410 [Chthoniobacterales bacterium]